MVSSGCKNRVLDVNILFFDAARELYTAAAFAGPAAATCGSAGFDLCASLPEGAPEIEILSGERAAVPTGIAIEPLQAGIAGFVYSRSGLGAAKGLTVAQGVGLIDPDYRGEILVYLLNTSPMPHRLRRGDRIAQLVFQPFYRPHWHPVDALGATERGAGGFGHTGQ